MIAACIHFTYGVIFDCEFIIVEWTMIEKAYACSPELIKSKNENTLESIRGEHMEGKSNEDVQFLYFQNLNMSRLPKDIDKIFPNVEGIEFHNANLSTISADDLKPYPKLLVFSSYFNKIGSLDGDTFKYNPKLKWANFHSNQIKHVGHDLLKDLKDLEFVNFEKNPCINTYGDSAKKIQDINDQLPIKCPPIIITSSELLRKITNLEEEISELSVVNAKSEKKIGNLRLEINELKDKVTELEKQIEKFNSRSLVKEMLSEISDYFFNVFTLF